MPAPTDEPSRYNGWLVLLWPTVAQRYEELRAEARHLKASLPADEYVRHPTVKLAAAISRLVTQIVPQGPNAPEYRLRGSLAGFRRAKGHGLPPRYRLFWVFSSEHKVIIFLYVNSAGVLRKQGDKNDVYAVFERLVRRGEIGADFETACARLEEAEQEPPTGAQGRKKENG